MLYQIHSYINFLLRSTNQHGVHSPFVYDLVSRCFYDKGTYEDYGLMSEHRQALYKDNSYITITDFGAGSRVFKSERRKISAIARTAGITKKRQRLLYRFAKYINAKSILELGTSLGLSTISLALANRQNSILTVEGCKSSAGKAQQYFNRFNLGNISLVNNEFEAFLENDIRDYDLVFIDGNHDREKTLSYFDRLKTKAHNDTVFIFDDIYWNRTMTEAWNQIAADEMVSVSIDTYYWGFVFFRREQEKQHFRIRM